MLMGVPWPRYKYPSAFTDITQGDNKCSTWQQCCDYGFYAQAGWDPVTGLGMPRADALLTIVEATGRNTPGTPAVAGL